MTASPESSVLRLPGAAPTIDDSAFVAAGARIIGDVRLGSESSVWYNAVLRADVASIRVGAGSNLQDNVSVHVDRGCPVDIGEDVSVGHNAVVHGCSIGSGSLVGMGSVVLSRAVVGDRGHGDPGWFARGRDARHCQAVTDCRGTRAHPSECTELPDDCDASSREPVDGRTDRYSLGVRTGRVKGARGRPTRVIMGMWTRE
jgi:acetyltransferase-like isoleucine patch superfamily enzyme